MIDSKDYHEDADAIKKEIKDINIALRNLEVYCKDNTHALYIASYIDERCSSIRKVFWNREVKDNKDIDIMLENVAKDHDKDEPRRAIGR